MGGGVDAGCEPGAQTVTGVDRMAHELALDYACQTIECASHPVHDRRGHLLWYDVSGLEDYERHGVARCMAYLLAVGRLRVRRSNPSHIKPVRKVTR